MTWIVYVLHMFNGGMIVNEKNISKKRTKKVTFIKCNRKVKVPMTDELLTEKQIRKILKQAGISEEEYIRLINEEESDVAYG